MANVSQMISEQTKKGRKKNVEQFTSSKTPSTRARRFVHKTRARADLYIKHGHTQGLKAISGRILVTYFREEEIKRFGNFGFIEARSRRERGIHARVHLRVKIYSLLSTANLSSVLSSR